jgi:hypothetical protein
VNRADPPVVLEMGAHSHPAGVARKAQFLVAPERLDAVLARFRELASERRSICSVCRAQASAER